MLPLCVQFGIQFTRAELAGEALGASGEALGASGAALVDGSASLVSVSVDPGVAMTEATAVDVARGGSIPTGAEQWVARGVAMTTRERAIWDRDSRVMRAF